jgi:uncharacterized protein (DUF924 family)
VRGVRDSRWLASRGPDLHSDAHAYAREEAVVIDPDAVLDFWFGADAASDPKAAAARGKMWFGSSAETDAQIRERFLPALEAGRSGELDTWRADARSALALVVLLDQFPRNAWRGSPRAFSCDAKALETARDAVARGHLERLAPIERTFLILPFEHSEALTDQHESVRLSREIVRSAPAAWQPLLEENLRYARDHLALIEKFGRFPHRNRVLGRASTEEEVAYLGAGGQTWGQSTPE